MIKKLQKDCQMLSTTVTGQAARVKEQDIQIAELIDKADKQRSELEAKSHEAEGLKTQLLSKDVPVAVTNAVVKETPTVEVREVIKYVDNPNSETCEQLRSELSVLREQMSSLETLKSEAESAF